MVRKLKISQYEQQKQCCLVTKQNCWFICVAIVWCLIMFTHNTQEYSIWEYTWKIANIKEIRYERMKKIYIQFNSIFLDENKQTLSLRNFHLGLDNQSNVLCVVTGQTRPLSACYIWINLIVHLTSVCITPAPSPRRVATLLKLLAGRDNLTVQHDHVTECLLAVARRNIQCIWSYSNDHIQKFQKL